MWIRDYYDPPDVTGGSIRLLLSPGRREKLPAEVTVPPATSANVQAAVAAWRRDLRSDSGNIALLYVAGHGIQMSKDGGIILLEDFADPKGLTPLTGAIDVQSVRLGIVSDPYQPGTRTPKHQFYFYDACRVKLPKGVRFNSLNAGITLDEPEGDAAETSFVCFGSRPGDYAFTDTKHRITLYSKAFLECLDFRATVQSDGRTVRFGDLQTALEVYVPELSKQLDEDQVASVGGEGKLTTPVHRRSLPQISQASFSGDSIFDREAAFDSTSTIDFDFEDLTRNTRPVFFHVHPPLPVVARAGDLIIGETAADQKRLQVPVGDGYEAVVPLPWGGELIEPFDVPASGDGDVHVSIDIPVRELRGVPKRGRETGLELHRVPRDYFLLRFLKWQDDVFQVDLTPRAFGATLLDTGDISLVISVEQPMNFYPPGDVSPVPWIRSLRAAPPLVQVDSGQGRSPLTVLPLAGGETGKCELIISFLESGISITARPGGAHAVALAGYLQSGRADRAVTAMTADSIALLQAKRSDPISAAIGGYALLKLNDTLQVRDWCENLANWYPALPDGAIIAGAVASRLGQMDTARRWFAAATDRGIPAFSEGLSLLVAETQRNGRRMDLGAIGDLALTADFSALCTTLHTAPSDSEEDWQKIVVPLASGPAPGISADD